MSNLGLRYRSATVGEGEETKGGSSPGGEDYSLAPTTTLSKWPALSPMFHAQRHVKAEEWQSPPTGSIHVQILLGTSGEIPQITRIPLQYPLNPSIAGFTMSCPTLETPYNAAIKQQCSVLHNAQNGRKRSWLLRSGSESRKDVKTPTFNFPSQQRWNYLHHAFHDSPFVWFKLQVYLGNINSHIVEEFVHPPVFHGTSKAGTLTEKLRFMHDIIMEKVGDQELEDNNGDTTEDTARPLEVFENT
ncbi:hypothetical protein EYC84_002950 [Monilinia fructicola]|uniref:Uncharacterized protein n=1 Tax=Monilinia fructicola TaxID=38448 RepID=A0A5M9JWS3_MONFR|nr:hypothetical protein EYC84_002950 [Monilinia fructicola]